TCRSDSPVIASIYLKDARAPVCLTRFSALARLDIVSKKRKDPKAVAKRELRRLERLAFEGRLINGVEIPPGAVLADRSKQVPNNSYSPPPLFYVDTEFTCKDCGRTETWTARQQKWYYEVTKGSLYAGAVRCLACRRKRAATKGRGDPNPIKHAGSVMKRIRA